MHKIVDDAAVPEAYRQALDILEGVGVRFDHEGAREVFEKRGARIDGATVFISRDLMEEALGSAPKQDQRPARARVAAASPFGNAPFILDDDTGMIRRCDIADAIKMYQLGETSDLYECANPGCADPSGNDAPDRFVGQIAMALKYSDKYLNIGLRATGSNAMERDVYGSARRAFRLVREFHDVWDAPVMTQGICPNPPLRYDRECLDNLCAAIDEKQAIAIFPCSMGFMTAPESILGIVVHDFAMALAGLAFIQLRSPGHPTSFSEFSTISNIRTLQPNYGSPESVFIQVLFYELCKHLDLPCSICGSYSDGTAVDYQAGMETLMTTILPFSLSDIREVWCYPGIMAGFACGSFQKAIYDEEMIRHTNRILKGFDATPDPKLPAMLAAGREAGSFLGVGSMRTYWRDNYMTKVFNKWGISKTEKTDLTDTALIAQKALEERIAGYCLPERSAAQEKILRPHLPSLCR